MTGIDDGGHPAFLDHSASQPPVPARLREVEGTVDVRLARTARTDDHSDLPEVNGHVPKGSVSLDLERPNVHDRTVVITGSDSSLACVTRVRGECTVDRLGSNEARRGKLGCSIAKYQEETPRKLGILTGMSEYLPRLVDPLLVARLASFPALMMVGPRASGKTTTALEFVRTTVRLDTPGEEAAFRADPDGALRGLEEPVLLDEWQNVPELLGAVKRSVDGDPSPGRFVLAGSVRAELDPLEWPGTGRVLPLRMHGLTLRELTGNVYGAGLLQRITDGEELAPPASTPDLRGYLELAVKGGFPQPAIRLSGADAEAWTRGYVDQLLTHDVAGVIGGRDSYRLHRYFTALASHSACVVDKKTLYGAAEIDAKTANAYEYLLTNLYLLDLVPAWSANRINRLARNPKRFLVDASLVTATLGMSVDGVIRDKDMLGRVLETFVAAQLRPELELGERPARPLPPSSRGRTAGDRPIGRAGQPGCSRS